MLVVLYHLWPGALRGGFVGVDVFFVISGFLITGHLLRDAERKGTISLVQFWTRRAFRLLPASLLVIALTMIAALIWVGEDQWNRYAQQALGSGFYVQNWVLSATSTDYLSSSEPPTAFQHFWSLSIEEQFYLVLPVVLVAVLAVAAAKWRTWFLVALSGITAASLCWSIYLTATNADAAYFVTTTRAWEFGLGALVAFARPHHLGRMHPALAWVGVAAITVSALTYSADTAFPGYAAVLPTAGAALALAVTRHERLFTSIAEWRPVQVIGDASYSIYLWHWPIFVIAPYALGRDLGLFPRVVILAASLVLGYLSLRFVEAPFRARGTARWKTPSGAAVAVGMTAVLVVSCSSLALVQQRSASSEEELRQAMDRIPSDSSAESCFGAPALGREDCPKPTALTPSLSLLRKDDGNRAACWASQGDATFKRCIVSNPPKPVQRVIAIGDSHNNSLIPAYEKAARTLNWKFEVAGKAGCYPSTTRIAVVDRDVRACETWRKKAMAQVAADPSIDTVIVTRRDAPVASTDASSRATTERGLRGAWSKFTAAGKKVVVVQDVPPADQGVLDCVSNEGVDAAQKCSMTRRAAFPDDATLRGAAQGQKGVKYLSVEDLYCLQDRCPSVIGSVPVFFNPGHVSKTFAATLGPALAEKLRASTR